MTWKLQYYLDSALVENIKKNFLFLFQILGNRILTPRIQRKFAFDRIIYQSIRLIDVNQNMHGSNTLAIKKVYFYLIKNKIFGKSGFSHVSVMMCRDYVYTWKTEYMG